MFGQGRLSNLKKLHGALLDLQPVNSGPTRQLNAIATLRCLHSCFQLFKVKIEIFLLSNFFGNLA